MARLLLVYQRKAGRPLLVGAEKYGRIGNRLYVGAHLVAWARKSGALLLYPGFHDCEQWFQATYQDALCRYPEPRGPLRLTNGFKGMIQKSINRLSIRMLASPQPSFQTVDLQPGGPDIGEDDFLGRITSMPVNFIRGFVYDNTQPDIAEEIQSIRHHFRPRDHYLPAIEGPVLDLRTRCDVVLGIVIRHGDFKTWRGGELYFETSDYVDLMDKAVSCLAPLKVGFFIASDEYQPPDAFQGHYFFFREGHPIENLCSLSLCDGMLAAESSFTGWSEYYGAVPAYHIRQELDKERLQTVLKLAGEKAVCREQEGREKFPHAAG